MVQLTLLAAESPTLGDHLHQLASRWSRLGGARHAEEAVRATAARFSGWAGRELSAAERDRVAAYFGGVVRRRLMRGADAETVSVRRHLVAAAIERDLLDAGWGRARAVEEARRVAGLEAGLSVVA